MWCIITAVVVQVVLGNRKPGKNAFLYYIAIITFIFRFISYDTSDIAVFLAAWKSLTSRNFPKHFVFFPGSQNLHQCQVERKIPIYLIVFGISGILCCLIAVKHKVQDEENSTYVTCIEGIICCFMFAWFITGNVWVYRNYLPSFQPKDSNYCDKTLYLFAFWLNTSVYIVLGIPTCCFCCCLCLSCVHDDCSCYWFYYDFFTITCWFSPQVEVQGNLLSHLLCR